MRPSDGEYHFGELARQIGTSFIPPPVVAGSRGLFRPLRWASTRLVGYAALINPVVPDLLSALMTGLCAYVLIRFHRTAGLPDATSNWSALWFFGCIPVVAMGQVTFASQFFMIGVMYGALALFEKFSTTRQARWLLLSAATFFVGGLYGESMIIAAVAVGCLSIVQLCERRVRNACETATFSLLALALVLGNRFLLSGDPAQISHGIQAVMHSRASTLDFEGQGDWLHRLWPLVSGYGDAFRRPTITSIVFSLSPIFCLTVAGAFIYNGLAQRNYFRAILMSALLVLAGCGLPASWGDRIGDFQRDVRIGAIGAALALLCLTSARRQPLLGCMVVAGVVVLGPIFIIDTHTTYVLPALAAVMFMVLGELLKALSTHGRRILAGGIVAMLAVIGVSNFAGGAYLCSSVVNDNERLASEVGDEIRHAAILTNFRHAFDLFVYANAARPSSQCEGDLWFTATVPFWGESRAVRDEQQLEHWLERARRQHKKAYFLVVDHDRLIGKTAFHGPQFLDSKHRFKLVKTHTFSAVVPCFDPLHLLGGYLRRHAMTGGFVGYPIFPDMIDDVGVEYAPFSKRMSACYRLLEIDPEDLGKPESNQTAPAVVDNFHGYRITAENQFFVAADTGAASGRVHQNTIQSTKLDTVLREIRRRDAEPHKTFPTIRIAEEIWPGTTIVVCDGRYFALATDLSDPLPFSLERWRVGQSVEAASVQGVKDAIENRVATGEAQLLLDGYHGFNLIGCRGSVFGLPQSAGAFDLKKAREHQYAVCFEGTSVEQVKRLVEASLVPAVSRKSDSAPATK
ncbi:MAG TPA: hypothetical protein VHV55_00950 [Pirellulales bacterium]|nr:hypothetical protein [Pirellulales bacterium]